MAYWIFKCNPERYHLDERLADPSPTITWLVTRYRDEIKAGDIVFLWQIGADRGIRAVIRVDEAPDDMPELEREQVYWSKRDDAVQCRIVGTLTHRAVNLGHEYLRGFPGSAELSVLSRQINQQATNFEVTPEQGVILMSLIQDAQPPGATDSPLYIVDGQHRAFPVRAFVESEFYEAEQALPLDELRRRALAAARPAGDASVRESLTTYHQRSAFVRNYVLARASGICESCRRPAPFQRPDGTPYLEPHHTTRLADDGPDHPRFVGGICPNCHREIHHGEEWVRNQPATSGVHLVGRTK